MSNQFKRPSEWMPNGCGAGWTGTFTPDELAGVEYDDCCDLHDLAYYRGGFLRLFWDKPRADVGLGACVTRTFYRAAQADWRSGSNLRRVKAAGKAALGTVAGPIYTVAVTLVGWTPFTWPWRRRAEPTHAQLELVKAALAD